MARMIPYFRLGLPDCKPVSVPRRAVVIPLGKALLPSSSNLPGSRTERAAPPPLFGLAPHGVCPARRIAPPAVRSYRTFSPLPKTQACARASGGIFSVALSVKSALSEPPRPLAGMLPYGDRTFLPIGGKTAFRATTRPARPGLIVAECRLAQWPDSRPVLSKRSRQSYYQRCVKLTRSPQSYCRTRFF